MGLFKRLIILFCLSFSLLYSEDIEKKQLLFLMHAGEYKQAFSKYLSYYQGKTFDFEVLQEMCLVLLDKGSKNNNSEIVQLSLLGAGFASSNKSIEILERGIDSSDYQTQLISLYFTNFIHDDKNEDLLKKAINSYFLPTKFEAAYQMAAHKYSFAAGEIEALMYKLPPYFKVFFPSLFTMIGSTEANILLKDLLYDENNFVRAACILSIAKFKRDDLLPIIRRKLTLSNLLEQETCVFALGLLKDSTCIDTIKHFSHNSADNIRIASCVALNRLGIDSTNDLKNLAEKGNLNAIYALKDFENVQDILYSLLKSKNIDIRYNSALALLEKKDSKALDIVLEILINNEDLGIYPVHSPGRSLMHWKTITSASIRKESEYNPEYFRFVKQSILKQAVELNEKDFLTIARIIFETDQLELIPTLSSLLENINTKEAINLLIYYSDKIGSPLIRNYCNLSLYKLNQEGPYETRIKNFLLANIKEEMIKFHPLLPRQLDDISIYSLNPLETSNLLMDIFEALASKQDEKSIKTVIEAIQKTNSHNRYVLAGILIRATQ